MPAIQNRGRFFFKKKMATSKSKVFLHIGKTVENRNYIVLDLGRRCMGIVNYITDLVICYNFFISRYCDVVSWESRKLCYHLRKQWLNGI